MGHETSATIADPAPALQMPAQQDIASARAAPGITAGGRNDYIQYLRGYAALMVVLDHSMLRLAKRHPAFAWLEGFAGDFGAMGVFIFFAISGYIMVSIAWNDFGKPGATGKFWLARIRRIVPLYWIATMVLLVVAALEARSFSIGQTVASMFFLPVDARPEEAFLRPVLGVGWTLNYEMFFYLVFGIALFLPRWPGLLVSMGVLAMLVGFGQVVGDQVPRRSAIFFYTHHVMLLFAAGMAMAVWQRSRWFRRLPIPAPAALGIGFAFAVMVALNLRMPGDYPLWRTLLMYGVACVPLLLCIVARPGRPAKYVELIGNASFSIYLFHGFVLSGVVTLWETWLGAAFPVARILVCVALGTGAGILAYLWIEKPLTRAIKPRRKRVQAPA